MAMETNTIFYAVQSEEEWLAEEQRNDAKQRLSGGGPDIPSDTRSRQSLVERAESKELRVSIVVAEKGPIAHKYPPEY